VAGSLTVTAPVGGVVVPLDTVEDQVFASGLLGPGCAIEPDPGESRVLAPVSGVVAALHPHAFVVRSEPERDVLVHLGIDTVGLDGAGFTGVLGVGAVVRSGDLVVRWDVAAIVGAGLSALCPVVALQAPPDAVRWLVAPGTAVRVGEPVFEWTWVPVGSRPPSP
jgi:sugar PTS system EIIA component